MPPALEAVARPHQAVDFDYERKVMQEEGASSMDAFMAKPEVGGVWTAAGGE